MMTNSRKPSPMEAGNDELFSLGKNAHTDSGRSTPQLTNSVGSKSNSKKLEGPVDHRPTSQV